MNFAADDIAALRRLRQDVSTWFRLSPAEIDALLPNNALARRPPTPSTARPFEFP